MDNIAYGEIGKPIKLEESEAHTTSVPSKNVFYIHTQIKEQKNPTTTTKNR